MQKSIEKNRRKHERKDLVFFLSVFDRNTGEHIGYLGDITPEGAMILTDECYQQNTELQLSFETTPDEPVENYIAVNAICVRCVQDENFIFYNCGLKITLINPDDINKINDIIEMLKIDD